MLTTLHRHSQMTSTMSRYPWTIAVWRRELKVWDVANKKIFDRTDEILFSANSEGSVGALDLDGRHETAILASGDHSTWSATARGSLFDTKHWNAMRTCIGCFTTIRFALYRSELSWGTPMSRDWSRGRLRKVPR